MEHFGERSEHGQLIAVSIPLKSMFRLFFGLIDPFQIYSQIIVINNI